MSLPDRTWHTNAAREPLDNLSVHLLRGREAILESKSILDQLARMSNQTGVMDDLEYFLSTPDARKKIPCLVLVPSCFRLESGCVSVEGFSGAMLLFEYKIFGLGSRLYASADTTGRRVVIAPASCRARVAAYACSSLLAKGAQVVLISIYEPGEDSHREILEGLRTGDQPVNAVWSLILRSNPLYLPLAATFNETLATIGKKTRTNLRYYRRRAEKDLGCNFISDVEIGIDEFVRFNRECAFPVSDEIARWRYESLSVIGRPLLQGVRDNGGRWLSLASGRRTGDQTILEWQCNRVDLPAASISTVMRSYLIEHEVNLGMKRLYFEGGTPSSLQQSFVEEDAADLTLYRRSAYVWIIRRLAGRLLPPKNHMAQILTDRKLAWTKL